MDIIELSSGHKLGLQIAPFKPANKLRKVLAAELLTVDLNLDLSKVSLSMDITKVDGKTLTTIKNLFCRLLSSDAVEAAFFDCAARCTLDGKKITPELFDDEQLRTDLLPVAQEVIRANVGPFFADLFSKLSTASAAPTASPE